MVETKHDDFYRRLRQRVARWADENKIKPVYRDALLALPDLFHLMCKLMLDARVANTDKAILGVGIAYVLNPIDLMPDFLGPLGFIDDLVVAAVVLDRVFRHVPEKVIKEHWVGGDDVMELVQRTIDKADDWFGRGLIRRVKVFLKDTGTWFDWSEELEPPPAEPAASPRSAKKKPAAKKPAAKKPAAKKKAARKKPAANKSVPRRKTGARAAKPRARKKKAAL